MDTLPLFIITTESTHVGSGSDIGFIDNPIQREKHTGFPKFESSGLKGALRDSCSAKMGVSAKERKTDNEHQDIRILFGPPAGEAAGALSFTNATILLFPVKSMKGIFAWVTCPWVLKRFQTFMRATSPFSNFQIDNIPPMIRDDEAIFGAALDFTGSGNAIIDEYVFKKLDHTLSVKSTQEQNVSLSKWLADNIYTKSLSSDFASDLLSKLIVVNDETFEYFSKMGCEVNTRNAIDPAMGSVIQGALFNVEYLPPDCVLFSLVKAEAGFTTNFKNVSSEDKANYATSTQVMNLFEGMLPRTFQIGGDKTIGKGMSNLVLLK